MVECLVDNGIAQFQNLLDSISLETLIKFWKLSAACNTTVISLKLLRCLKVLSVLQKDSYLISDIYPILKAFSSLQHDSYLISDIDQILKALGSLQHDSYLISDIDQILKALSGLQHVSSLIEALFDLESSPELAKWQLSH